MKFVTPPYMTLPMLTEPKFVLFAVFWFLDWLLAFLPATVAPPELFYGWD